jgi:glycosyltransferase involved in cell wall biosynthesis
MKLSTARLLIHHHHPAFVDAKGSIWLSSVMGRWVDALAGNVGEIRLLFYQNEFKQPAQDTLVRHANVKLVSLGTRKTFLTLPFATERMEDICQSAGRSADILLIRGVTPKQSKIWQHTPTPLKIFLLVGNLKQNLERMPRSLVDLIVYIRSYYHLITVQRMSKNNTLILANSPLLASETQRILNAPVHFVPTNSIAKEEFIPLTVRLLGSPPRLLYCGRLDYQKGLRELLQALSELKNQGIHCVLDIVAAKSEPIYSQLVNLAEKLGLRDCVEWYGFVSYGPDLFKYYQDADIFVLPSYSEGFPHVIWESAANCCPIITTSVGGIPALIKHEEHALLIPPKNVEAIVSSVKRLLFDSVIREKIIKNAYHHAQAFSVEACAQQLVDVLERELK